MRLCQSCSLKIECKEICESVETYLFENKGYKTTYSNRETTSIQVFEEDGVKESLSEYISNQYYFTENFSQYIPKLKRIVASQCTPKQQSVFKLWFTKRLSFVEIGKQLRISTQAAHEHIYGHSTKGGGLIRKLLKHLELETT
jgi:DNA-directed RNA polymerase specialized sigma subunit